MRICWLTAFGALVLAPLAAGAQSPAQLDDIVAGNVRALGDKLASQRSQAAIALGNTTGDKAQCRATAKAMPALLKALGDPDTQVRAFAAFAIGTIQAGSPDTVPALIAALADPDPGVRTYVARALSPAGNCADYVATPTDMHPAAAVPALAAALRDKDPAVREAADAALQAYGRDASRALPALIALLADTDRNQRYAAAEVLAAIGPDALPAVDPLTALLRDETIDVRLEAAAALAQIGANLPQAVPVAARALADDDIHIRRRAAYVLGRFGAAAQPAIPRLTAALSDSDPDLQRLTVTALRSIAQALLQARRTDAIKGLRTAAAATERSNDAKVIALGPDLTDAADQLEALRTANGR